MDSLKFHLVGPSNCNSLAGLVTSIHPKFCPQTPPTYPRTAQYFWGLLFQESTPWVGFLHLVPRSGVTSQTQPSTQATGLSDFLRCELGPRPVNPQLRGHTLISPMVPLELRHGARGESRHSFIPPSLGEEVHSILIRQPFSTQKSLRKSSLLWPIFILHMSEGIKHHNNGSWLLYFEISPVV